MTTAVAAEQHLSRVCSRTLKKISQIAGGDEVSTVAAISMTRSIEWYKDRSCGADQRAAEGQVAPPH